MVKVIEKILRELHEDHKKLRQVLGLMMMFSFIYFALFIYGFISLVVNFSYSPTQIFLAIIGLIHLWSPHLILIVLLYFLLTRVYPYDNGQ